MATNSIAANTTAGLDGFHAQLLKNCKHQLAKSLKILWAKSLDSGNIPEAFKVGIITIIQRRQQRIAQELQANNSYPTSSKYLKEWSVKKLSNSSKRTIF